MKHYLLLFVLLLSLPLSTQAQDNSLNEKYGFRDAIFEKHLSAFKAMKLVSAKGHEKTFTRTTDKPKIGDYEASIRYKFFDNQLSEIQITAVGAENVNGIIFAMIEAYGTPLELPSGYAWKGTRVAMQSRTYGSSEKSKVLVLTMSSIPMSVRQEEIEEQERQAAERVRTLREIKGAKKAASDL